MLLNMDKIKINKKFLFTEDQLLNYLKTVKTFSKLEEEILATLTYKKAYFKIYMTDFLITFPYKLGHEQEILNRPLLLASEIGIFLKKHIEDNSYYDSILVNPVNNKQAIVKPLQIKYLGKGEYRNVTTDKFIKLLEKYINHESNEATLVIVLDGPIIKIQLQKVVKWLNKSNYPFPEVILIESNIKTGDMIYYQLKPNKNGVFNSLSLSRDGFFSQP